MNLDVRLTLQSLSGPFTSQRNEEPPGIQDVLSRFYCLLPGVWWIHSEMGHNYDQGNILF